MILTLFTLLALFVIAGCGQNQKTDKNVAQSDQKTATLSGEWESVDELESIQKVFIPKGMKGITFARFIEAFKDFKMALKVDGNTVNLSYDYDVTPFAKAFYSIYRDKDKIKQQKLISLKKFIKASQVFLKNSNNIK